MEISRNVTRSALRYFGGKWALAPWIIQHMPPHRVYVEPFGGAASVLLRKPRSRIEVYNDLDAEIVGIFRVLQNADQCRKLVRLLKRTPYARQEFETAFQPTDDPIIRAQRAMIRSFMSFHHSALFSSRKSTFASSKHRRGGASKAGEWRSYPRALAHIRRRLAGVVIESRDAHFVIRNQDTPDALFFVDPPYVMSARHKQACYRHEMTDDQHVALLRLLRSVAGRVMISGYASDLYDDMLAGWTRVTKQHYAASGAGHGRRTEVLWMSPEPR